MNELKQLSTYGMEKEEFIQRVAGQRFCVFLDLSALLYPKSRDLIEELEKSEFISCICLEQKYQENWKLMLGDACGRMVSKRMKENGDRAYEYINEQRYQEKNDADVIQLVVTGNDTEACRLLLKREIRFVILINMDNVYFFDSRRMERQAETMIQCNMMETFGANGQFFSKRGKQINVLDFEVQNRIYERTDNHRLIKECPAREKLEWMLTHKPEIDNFAWPEQSVYRRDAGWKNYFKLKGPVGYEMKKRVSIRRLEEFFICGSDVPTRYELCIRLIKNVLYLHMQGVLIIDYNLENFQIDENGNLIMLDCGDYAVHNLRSYKQAPKEQSIDRSYDYEKRLEAIKAEYRYLQGVIYCILSNGLWPFKNNDRGRQRDTPTIADEIIDEDLTPYEILCRVGKEYVRRYGEEINRNHLMNLEKREYVKNPYLKRRPVLILIENSGSCTEVTEEINECLRSVLEELCKDRLTCNLTDALILSYAKRIRSIGMGKTKDGFQTLSNLRKNEISVFPMKEETKLGIALLYAVDVLEEKRKDYREQGVGAKMPTVIFLGRFQAEDSDELQRGIKSLNAKVNDNRWTVVCVKFGKDDFEIGSDVPLAGDKIEYRGKKDVKKIVSSLHYASSLIMETVVEGTDTCNQKLRT